MKSAVTSSIVNRIVLDGPLGRSRAISNTIRLRRHGPIFPTNQVLGPFLAEILGHGWSVQGVSNYSVSRDLGIILPETESRAKS